jgi:hypothetical protein
MKKKSASQFAFFNLRVSIAVVVVLAGAFLALAGSGVLSATARSTIQAMPKGKIITSSTDALVPVGFDCSTIHEKAIDKQENFRAGAIMIACGQAAGGSTSATSTLGPVGRFIQKLLAPLAYGASDVNLITGAETSPNVTQSETYTLANPDNPLQIVTAYNDSRGRNNSPINISGASVSADGGSTFTRLILATGQGPFSNTEGDPVVLYHKPTGTWFTVWLDLACGGQGLGGYKSTTPENAASWSHFPCVHSNSQDDRESGWSDNNPASPNYGRMYVSWNDFNVNGGALFVTYSTDAGATWHAPIQVANGAPFIRNVQITGDLSGNGVMYIAGMDEGGGGFPHNNINHIFKSTDGGNTWSSTYTGPSFPGPGVTAPLPPNNYFACMFSDGGGYWRHEGWGEPAAYDNVVHLVYAQHGTGSDTGDVYYIRSTNGGSTFSAPLKLNSDGTTRPQWQPNISVSPSGTLLATWYDGRESASCARGSTGVPCYRMWSRKSNDNGVTWLPDNALSDVVTPLPAQPDPGIQSTYAGDYDYGSATAAKHVTSWTDGRVAIAGSSQQDAYTDRELVGVFGVTTTTPACDSVLNTQPTDFVVNLTDSVNTSTVEASDFTVNGTPSNLTPTFSNGDATITFHFSSSPVTMQGAQTMHIAAGAFNRQSDNAPNPDFTCTFCYALMPLQVTTTNPPVGGTFSPPAPGDYQYDVNFNQAVDPASVQTSDLTLTGNTGGSVTAVQLVNGNMTARFTLHFNFGGSVTASIGAGAITASTCNGNAAFTETYAVEGCPPASHYDIAQIGGSIVPGTTDIGNHGDDDVTTISLPFPYSLYDQTFNSINLSSNGNAQFTTTDNAFTNQCLPWTSHNYTIFPYWDDLYLVNSGFGIFTSVSGTAPNRIFNIEWRTQYYPGTGTARFELRLYEGQNRFDVIYGTADMGNTSVTAGVQKNDATFDQYFCSGSGGQSTGGQSYILQTCGTPSPTPTATATATPTVTPTPTPCTRVAPRALSATNVSFSSFTANWSSVSGAIDYRLDVSTSNSFPTYVVENLNVGNITSFPVTGLNPHTTYYYRVRANNGCAISPNSNVKNVQTLACMPAAPSAQAATDVAFSSFTANWRSVTGAIDYRLDVSTTSNFATYVLEDFSVGNMTSFPVTGLTAHTTYYYRVRADNGCARSSNSSVKNVQTLPCTPPAPNAQSATLVTPISFTANWRSVSGAIDYRLDVSTNNSFTTYVLEDLPVGNMTSFPVIGLSPHTTYYYRVRADNGCAISANSNVKSIQTSP